MNRQQLLEVVEIFKEVTIHSPLHEKRESAIRLRSFLKFTQPTPSQAEAIRYHLAGISLSLTDPESQLPALLELRESAPLRAFEILRHAFRVWFEEALALYENNPANPALIGFHRALSAIHFSPYWLRFAVARLWILSGHPELKVEAKTQCRTLLKLSPRDPQYLEGCIEIALLANDSDWLEEIKKQVLRWRDLHPCHMSYLKLEKRLNESEVRS